MAWREGARALPPAIANLLSHANDAPRPFHIASKLRQLHFTVTITYLYRYSALRPLLSELYATQPLSACVKSLGLVCFDFGG